MCRTDPRPTRSSDLPDAAFAAKLSTLAAMPADFAAQAASIPAPDWQRGAANGNFSVHQHVCHLRDIDIEGYRMRIERMLSEVIPTLVDLDGAKLARERNYHRQDVRTAQAAWAAVRADLVRRLAGLTQAERQRTGVMEGVGEITVDGLIEMMLAHDREHRDDLAALGKELRSGVSS
jgi:hypothetical protein